MKRTATILSIATVICWAIFILLRLALGKDVFIVYRLEGWLLVVATLLSSVSIALWLVLWLAGKHILVRLTMWLLYLPITLIWLLFIYFADHVTTNTALFDNHFDYLVCSNDNSYVVRGEYDGTFEVIFLYHREGALERRVCWLDRYYDAYIEELIVNENDDLVILRYHYPECTSKTDTFHLDGELYH